MDRQYKFTVGDIFKNPYFKDAEFVAGKGGASRLVRWVHVLEISEVGELLSGNEVILSTGVGWAKTSDGACSFLRQLIEHHASGLCVELGSYIERLPEEMIQLAEAHDFPLIVFYKEVRFIDITHHVNTFLMETPYKMMTELEAYSNKLNHLLLGSSPFKAILRALHQNLNVQVVYKPLEGEITSFPEIQEASFAQIFR